MFRALGLEYLGRSDIVQIPPKNKQQAKPITVEEKTQTTVPFQQAKPITVEQAENSVATVQEVLGNMMGDAPACPDCGHITIRNGSCYKCLNCGNSLGCS